MGCNHSSQTTFESVINDAFDSLIIKRTEMSDMIEELNSLKNHKDEITETNFQRFFNKYLIPSVDRKWSEENKEWLKYWMEFYRQKTYNYRLPLIKFAVFMLSRTKIDPNDNKDSNFKELIEIINKTKKSDSKLDITTPNQANFKYISIDELFNLLKDYIFSISLLTIDFFKNFHSEPVKLELFLSKLWRKEIIDEFIKITFFNKNDILNIKISIKKFLKNYLFLLKDHALLRSKLTSFSIEYQNVDINIYEF
jgi:hypothetical protein